MYEENFNMKNRRRRCECVCLAHVVQIKQLVEQRQFKCILIKVVLVFKMISSFRLLVYIYIIVIRTEL